MSSQARRRISTSPLPLSVSFSSPLPAHHLSIIQAFIQISPPPDFFQRTTRLRTQDVDELILHSAAIPTVRPKSNPSLKTAPRPIRLSSTFTRPSHQSLTTATTLAWRARPFGRQRG